jgi:hypothetical protein
MKQNSQIVRASISPGIGIARVGNSEQEFFIGPEVPHFVPPPSGGYKDQTGALKRQGARFRIYGFNADGQIVREITPDDAEITWTVHVANKKAAWYRFHVAMDIPESVPVARRNANFTGEARQQLIIDPGPRSISGKNQSGTQYSFDTGEFIGEKVYLGELRTDEAGRLVFLGGRGRANTPFPNNSAYTFANNDGWHDDISDGPVSADVSIGGKSIPVDPAWVVTAPPNYAPDIISVQTMYDVMYNTFQGYWLTAPPTPSFTQDIYPLLLQFCNMQWVNFGFYIGFGHGAPNDFHHASLFRRLTDNGPASAELRRQVFNIFRNPDFSLLEINAWPQIYGDNMNQPLVDARQFLALTPTHYQILRAWSRGNFIADWDENAPPPPNEIDAYPLQSQPDTLDRAALTFCMGGPFHPGCEITWISRNPSLYRAAFRIRPRAESQPEQDYGDMLSPAAANDPSGPLFGSGPGDLTRWMAVPWQTDTASCRAGYDPEYSPFLPTFWPARVPNHVLAEADYKQVLNKKLSRDERLEAFNRRSSWPRFLRGAWLDQINQMIDDFGKLGVIEPKPGVADDRDFPTTMYVESEAGFKTQVPHDQNTVIGPTAKVKPLGRVARPKK